MGIGQSARNLENVQIKLVILNHKVMQATVQLLFKNVIKTIVVFYVFYTLFHVIAHFVK